MSNYKWYRKFVGGVWFSVNGKWKNCTTLFAVPGTEIKNIEVY